MTMHFRTWTQEKVDLLTELWAVRPQLTAQTIGRTLGFSRSAVIGQAHRLKLPPHERRPPDYLTEVPAPARSFVPDCNPVSFMDLTESTCRWPLGETGPDQTFCGTQPESNRPYCGAHCRMAYRPARGPKPGSSFVPRRGG